MGTEIWMRNPHSYIREMVEVGYTKIAWQRGSAIKRKIDPIKHASLYFGRNVAWDVLWIGPQGAAHYKPESSLQKPWAVYPVWDYAEDKTEDLEELIAKPVGSDAEKCKGNSDETPVYLQPHRVVVINPPAMNQPAGKRFLRHLQELQEDYPDCIVHLHGTYAVAPTCAHHIKAADFEPRTWAGGGRVMLGNGKILEYEKTADWPMWLKLMGVTVGDLAVPRNRCMFNIRTLAWAGENFDREVKFAVKSKQLTLEEINADTFKRRTASHLTKPTGGKIAVSSDFKKNKPGGDAFVCDFCSLRAFCKYYREGAVCAVPGSEPASLAKYFNTRDSGTIIEGLGSLLEANTKRLERAYEKELEDDDGLDPKVSTLMNNIFSNGIKLAKLVDPTLSGPKVAVNINNGDTVQVSNANPKQLVAEVVRAFELQGIKKHQITPKMIAGVFSAMSEGQTQQAAIENVKIIEHDA